MEEATNSNAIEPGTFHSLPDSVKSQIFAYLDAKTVREVTKTCLSFYNAAKNYPFNLAKECISLLSIERGTALANENIVVTIKKSRDDESSQMATWKIRLIVDETANRPERSYIANVLSKNHGTALKWTSEVPFDDIIVPSAESGLTKLLSFIFSKATFKNIQLNNISTDLVRIISTKMRAFGIICQDLIWRSSKEAIDLSLTYSFGSPAVSFYGSASLFQNVQALVNIQPVRLTEIRISVDDNPDHGDTPEFPDVDDEFVRKLFWNRISYFELGGTTSVSPCGAIAWVKRMAGPTMIFDLGNTIELKHNWDLTLAIPEMEKALNASFIHREESGERFIYFNDIYVKVTSTLFYATSDFDAADELDEDDDDESFGLPEDVFEDFDDDDDALAEWLEENED